MVSDHVWTRDRARLLLGERDIAVVNVFAVLVLDPDVPTQRVPVHPLVPHKLWPDRELHLQDRPGERRRGYLKRKRGEAVEHLAHVRALRRVTHDLAKLALVALEQPLHGARVLLELVERVLLEEDVHLAQG